MGTVESADSGTLVARVLPESLEMFQNKVVPALHKQARLNIFVGVGFAVLILAIFALAVTSSDVDFTYEMVLGFLGALVIPVWLVILGIRRVRRRPSLAEVALTVTDDFVILGPRERLTLFSRWRPELCWDRRTVEAEFVAAKPLVSVNAIKLTYHDGRGRRSQYLATDVLDTTVEEILAAIRRP